MSLPGKSKDAARAVLGCSPLKVWQECPHFLFVCGVDPYPDLKRHRCRRRSIAGLRSSWGLLVLQADRRLEIRRSRLARLESALGPQDVRDFPTDCATTGAYGVCSTVAILLPPIQRLVTKRGHMAPRMKCDVIVAGAGPGDSLFIVTPSNGDMLHNCQSGRRKGDTPVRRRSA